MDSISYDLQRVARISIVPTILDVVLRITGMGFATVARVTTERWVACSVLDHMEYGLQPGQEVGIETTLCHEVHLGGSAIAIDDVGADVYYCNHHTPKLYGFTSYISVPINLPDGRFFGTLCAIDNKPFRVNAPEIRGMFDLFAHLIGLQLSLEEKRDSGDPVLAS